MRAGTTLSVIAHVGLIAWGVVSIATPRPLHTSKIEAIPVALVRIDDVTAAPKLAPPPPVVAKPAAAPAAAPSPPAPAPVAAEARPVTPVPPTPKPQPPARAPVAAPAVAKSDPAPAPAPAPPPAAAEPVPAPVASIPAPPAVALPKPRIAPAPPAPVPVVKAVAAEPFDIDKITAVLDRPRPQAATAPTPPAAPAPPQPQPDALALSSLIASAAEDAHLTVSEVDALRARIAACWTPPPGWVDPADVRVVMIIALNPDGSVAAPPEVVQAPAGRYQQTAPESAVRAVRACAPYALPAAKYEEWKAVKITFDPRAMATG
jgi:hypothetical protein